MKHSPLKLKAAFMIFLVLAIPFFTSVVFAQPYETKTKEVNTPLMQGPGMDPGQACNYKVEQVNQEIANEEEGLRVLEGIIQTFGAICTTTSSAFLVYDTIRMALAEATNILTWDCAKPTFSIDPGQEGFLNSLLTICSLATSGVVCGGANELMKAGYLPQYVAPECNEITKQTTNVLGNALTVGIDPYASIYEAAVCLSPAGILYNARKKRMIDQAYSCCTAQACEYGLPTETCEQYRSYAMCMYEEGAIKKMMIRTLAAAISGTISEFISCAFISQGIKPYCPYLIFNIAAIPGLIKGIIGSIQLALDAFDTPTCSDLGFGDIKEAVTAEDPRTPWHMNDFNLDGKYDKVWKKYDEVEVDVGSVPADLKKRLDDNKAVIDPAGATYKLRAGYNTETSRVMKTYNVNFKNGKKVEYALNKDKIWDPVAKGEKSWTKNYVAVSDTPDLPSSIRPKTVPIDDDGDSYYFIDSQLVELPAEMAAYVTSTDVKRAIRYGWRGADQGDIMDFKDQQGNEIHIEIPAGEPGSYVVNINLGKPNQKVIRYNSEEESIQVQQAVPEKAAQTIKYEAGMDDLFDGGDNINWDATTGDKIILNDGKTVTKDISKGYIVKNRWGNEIEYRRYEPIKNTADGRVKEVIKSVPNNGPKTVFKTIEPRDGNNIEVSYNFDNPAFLEPNAIIVKRVDKETGTVLAEIKISEDSIKKSNSELLAKALDDSSSSELAARSIESIGPDFSYKEDKFISKDGLKEVSFDTANSMMINTEFNPKNKEFFVRESQLSGLTQGVIYKTEKGTFTATEFNSEGIPIIRKDNGILYTDGSYEIYINGKPYYYDGESWIHGSKQDYDENIDVLNYEEMDFVSPEEISSEALDVEKNNFIYDATENKELLGTDRTIQEDAEEKRKESKEKIDAEKDKIKTSEVMAGAEGLTAYERVLWKNLIFQAVWAITGLILDKVYEDIDESCKEEYMSSEPESNTPWSGDNKGGSGGSGGPGGDHGTGGACNTSNSTILTAQLYRIGNNTPYDYDYTFTITACKEPIDYWVTLEDGDVLNIAQGSVAFENISAGADTFTSSTAYDEICVNVTDILTGKACFPYAVP